MCRYAPFVTLRNEGSLIEHGFSRCSNTLIKRITLPIFQALLTDYLDKRYAYKQGRKAQKSPYQEARAALT